MSTIALVFALSAIATAVLGALSQTPFTAWHVVLFLTVALVAPISVLALRYLIGDVESQRRRADALDQELRRHVRDSSTQIAFEHQRFEDLVRACPAAILETDGEGRVVYAGGQWVELTGVPTKDVIGRPWTVTVHPDDRESADRSWSHAHRSRAGFTSELRLAADGGRRWCLVHAVPRADREGHVTVMLDVTDRVAAEEQRRRLESRAHQAEKLESLGLLAGGVAHDFNNLLVAILGGAEVVRSRLAEADDATVARLGKIEEAAMRAADLAQQMLAYAGRGEHTVEPICVSQVVSETARLLELPAGIELRLELSQELPRVHGSRAQLSQLAMNLLVNGAEACAGKGNLTLRTSEETLSADDLAGYQFSADLEPGAFVVLEVEDDGRGMSKDVVERAFEPFFSTKSGGRGLGMATVFGVLRSHGGAVHIRSTEGEGTLLRVALPLLRAASGRSGTPPSV